MAVYMCFGCGRLISLSMVPGGNPVAKKDPDLWAQSWQKCPDCQSLFCDRCAPKHEGPCLKCGSALVVPDNEIITTMYYGSSADKVAETILVVRKRK